jgi:hypothetical protein
MTDLEWAIPIEVLLAMNCMYIEHKNEGQQEDNMDKYYREELNKLADRAKALEDTNTDLLETLETLALDFENNGEVLGTDQNRLDLIQQAIAKAR